MKKLAVAVAMIVAGGAFAQNVDLAKSKIKWEGSKVVGGGHWGYVGIKEAKVDFDKAGEPVSGRIVVDMSKIEVGDKDMKEDGKKGLIGHLSSPDFFDVANHKEAVFVAKTFTKISSAKDKEAKYKVDGELTIRGKTHPESIEMEVERNKNVAKVEGELNFNRTKYDVMYNSSKALDFVKLAKEKVINDNIELEIDLVMNK